MRTTALIFPHQLFKNHPIKGEKPEKILLIEDSLFFSDEHHPLKMHSQKLFYHRETMQAYAKQLEKIAPVEWVTWSSSAPSLQSTCAMLAKSGFERVVVCDLHDDLLHRRLQRSTTATGLQLDVLPTPMFLNTSEENQSYREGKKRWFMADFYQWQRRRFNVLMDGSCPAGGQWSFDEDNRKKMPAKHVSLIPSIPNIQRSKTHKYTAQSVADDFPNRIGELDKPYYPSTHIAANRWLDTFLSERFEQFGTYEDAMVQGENWLHHSVLTPMLNIGLLTPQQVLKRTMDAAETYKTPLNSVEGFVRQLIGWREFMRATYEDLGVEMRTTNHWNHTRPMPDSFYTATTGIDPVDDVIQRVLHTGYCHHIERLMVLGGFMFLCEIDPDDIYRWFMEMFVDSYDWVMVPNVYAMSQNADGGNITTKPYFSGSNYIIKMSHYKKGQWSEVWDALFWAWIFKHKANLAKNPRWAMMCKNAERMDTDRANHLQTTADQFLASLR